MVPWVNICSDAPVSPRLLTLPATPATDDIPSKTKPMWLTLENAISRFRSVCRMVTTAPYSTFTTPAVASSHATSDTTPGNIATETRIMP